MLRQSRFALAFILTVAFTRIASACTCLNSWDTDPNTGQLAHPPVKIGVNVQLPPFNDLARNANIGWIRTGVRWSTVEKTKGSFDFSEPMSVILDARSRGLKVLASFGHPPTWAGSNANGTTPPANLVDWQNYVNRTAQEFAGLIDAYEVWNEPDLMDSGDGVGWNAQHNEVGNPYSFIGFGLHDELAELVDAGLTPMQALQAASRNPAQFVGKPSAIQEGMPADLVLLNGNPLENIRNTRGIEAVVVNGKLVNRDMLDELLRSVEAAARN